MTLLRSTRLLLLLGVWLAASLRPAAIRAQLLPLDADWAIEVGSGHTAPVTSSAFAADGASIFTASQDGTVKRWEVGTGRLISSWTTHTAGVLCISIGPDGDRIALGSRDGVVQVRRLEDGAVQQLFTGHGGEVNGVAFSPDGRFVVSAGGDATVRLWSIAAGVQVNELAGPPRAVNAVAFGPDGSVLYAAAADSKVYRWTFATRKPLPPLPAGDNVLTSLAVSRDGRWLAAGSWDEKARLWDLRTGRLVRTLAGHKAWVSSVAFSPDSSLLATGGRDRDIALWSVRTGARQAGWTAHQAPIASVAFARDGRSILSASWDGSARLWSTGTPGSAGPAGTPGVRFAGQSQRVAAVACSSDGRWLAAGYLDGSITLWDVANGRALRSWAASPASITALAFGPGPQLASGSADGTVLVWDATRAARGRALAGHQKRVTRLEFSPDGRRLLTSSLDRTFRIWNVETGLLEHRVQSAQGVTAAAFAAGGTQVVAGGDGGAVMVWIEATDRVERALSLKGPPVTGLEVSPDGALAAVSDAQGVTTLWLLADGRPMRRLAGHAGSILSTAFSPDGRHVVTAGVDLGVLKWTVSNGDLETLIRPMDTPSGALCWLKDGSSLAVGSGGLALISASTGRVYSVMHRVAGLSVVTAPSGVFSAPEAAIPYVLYRRLDRARPAAEAPACYLPEGFDPRHPPDRPRRCDDQLYERPLKKAEVDEAPPPPSAVHLLAVGVGELAAHTASRPLNRRYAASDAKKVVDRLKKVYGKGLEVQGGRALVDAAATRQAILDGIDAAVGAADGRRDALAIVYFSGRAVSSGGGLTLWPADFRPDAPVLSTVSLAQIEEILSRHDARVLLVIDAGAPVEGDGARSGSRPAQDTAGRSVCGEAGTGGASAAETAGASAPGPCAVDRATLYERLASSRPGTWILAASAGDVVYEDKRFCRKGGGAFTCLWLEGLAGKADRSEPGMVDGDRRITMTELARYLETRLPMLTLEQADRGIQQPVFKKYGGVLTLGRR